MKKAELSQTDYEFILLMSAKPKTKKGKRLVDEASHKYHDKINWSGLAGTPIAGTDDQKKAVVDLIDPCDFTE
ncbi:hypothetical protein A3J19_01675 [Candidatus Daviesbacteria bacterium RIFCSPLOWO2_02_FULL_41_8]|uniref:Uncharacterized protein n=1 Tax=Candidatus Daviesbacteria bacterium RIFCSPLOWO2_02_FULL_41_8 TaxID=1797798 RepID=A0A1F5NIV6_9BACT|nr:MAG: hypothetical protein A3J19_01675 [Candidatus Daviesbacteria bacterium RIFCSPLOWO2_02_FULL_41_8]OGI16592.1 MAG: hypothetical protein A3J63_01960 [Candidatus Moranbacteria bacterium RIFCSPHIGHO2_02_FULL_40_12b]OGI23393.1 MAG: hypothetical protein A3E91_02465 [Candidatus Moranbacteria bacterium RIFCSPHIGHO2_12_FULL_40_10]